MNHCARIFALVACCLPALAALPRRPALAALPPAATHGRSGSGASYRDVLMATLAQDRGRDDGAPALLPPPPAAAPQSFLGALLVRGGGSKDEASPAAALMDATEGTNRTHSFKPMTDVANGGGGGRLATKPRGFGRGRKAAAAAEAARKLRWTPAAAPVMGYWRGSLRMPTTLPGFAYARGAYEDCR